MRGRNIRTDGLTKDHDKKTEEEESPRRSTRRIKREDVATSGRSDTIQGKKLRTSTKKETRERRVERGRKVASAIGRQFWKLRIETRPDGRMRR